MRQKIQRQKHQLNQAFILSAFTKQKQTNAKFTHLEVIKPKPSNHHLSYLPSTQNDNTIINLLPYHLTIQSNPIRTFCSKPLLYSSQNCYNVVISQDLSQATLCMCTPNAKCICISISLIQSYLAENFNPGSI